MTGTDPTVLSERANTNDLLHDAISGTGGNPRLLAEIRANRLFHFNRRIAALYSDADLDTSSRQHAELITIVCTGDADWAGDIAREHVEFSLQLILNKLF
ncbi:FCD domain-containing protein [Streptomyces hainanensis]|uniref:FCD domain-containing protein n=1 Tax=Streptomyces hainanensis TaxID=402648 RepID=A0A4R4TFZ7_9ACTN|nr:FCD domain-containing protein [Streptomyces hainanensis]TDC74534.1 FCD domain-containing protein [Streptomyces hainanensis]